MVIFTPTIMKIVFIIGLPRNFTADASGSQKLDLACDPHELVQPKRMSRHELLPQWHVLDRSRISRMGCKKNAEIGHSTSKPQS